MSSACMNAGRTILIAQATGSVIQQTDASVRKVILVMTVPLKDRHVNKKKRRTNAVGTESALMRVAYAKLASLARIARFPNSIAMTVSPLATIPMENVIVKVVNAAAKMDGKVSSVFLVAAVLKKRHAVITEPVTKRQASVSAMKVFSEAIAAKKCKPVLLMTAVEPHVACVI